MKNMRKIYKETKKSNQKDTNIKTMSADIIISDNTYIKKGTIIQINEFSEETFEVKDTLDDILICISSFETKAKNPKKHYFNKNSVIVVGVKQKRK